MKRSGRLATGAAASSIAATLAAITSALCCVGPLAYLVLGASGALAAARIAPARPYLIAASVITVLLGFLLTRRRDSACRTRATAWTRVLLWIAAVLTLAALIVPEILT